MASSLKFAAYWDLGWYLGYAGLTDLYEAGMAMHKKIRQMLPNVQITISAYGNSESITKQQREELSRASVRLRDTTGRVKNDADRVLMCEMLEFALKSKGPSYIMLVSGDAAFYRAFEAIRKFGHTTISLFQENMASDLLTNSSCYKFWLNNLCQQNSLKGPDGETFSLELENRKLFQPQDHKDPQVETSIIFWDMNTCPLPSNLSHRKANEYLLRSLKGNTNVTAANLTGYKVYGHQSNFPAKRCKVGADYIATTTEENKQHNNLDNRMIADMMNFAFEHKPPSTIVVLTSNENLTCVIHSLRNLGHKIILLVPTDGCRYLQDAATNAGPCPKWETLLNNKQATVANKKSKAKRPNKRARLGNL